MRKSTLEDPSIQKPPWRHVCLPIGQDLHEDATAPRLCRGPGNEPKIPGTKVIDSCKKELMVSNLSHFNVKIFFLTATCDLVVPMDK